jgi:hypothetical protein
MPESLYDAALKDLAGTPLPSTETAAPAKPSIYETTFLERQGAQESQLRTSMKQAVDTTPERAGQVQQLAERVGLPASVVERNFDAIQKRAKVDDTEYARMLREAPKLSNWLTANPAHAAVAQNDLPRLRQVEELLTFTGSLRRGVDVAQGSYFSTIEALGEAIDSEDLIAYGREGRRRNAAEAAAHGERSMLSEVRTFGDFTQWAKEIIGDQIPIMGTTVGGAVAGATAGTFIAGPIGTTIGGFIGAFAPALVFNVGDVAASVKGRGEDVQAPLAVFIGGTAAAALDVALPGQLGSRLVKTLGLEVAEQVAKRFLMKPVTAGLVRRTAQGTVEGMLTEGVTEALQEAIGEVSAAKGTGTPISPDIWTQMFEAGAAGALMGGVVTVGTGTVEAVQQRRTHQAAAAQHQANVLTAIGQRLAGSEAGANLPAAVESFLASATADGPMAQVYAPVTSWTEYWQQKGVDPAAVAAELTGDPKAYETAVRTGEDLVIPTARYLAGLAGTEHNAFLAQELHFRPGEFNARESAEFLAQIEVDRERAGELPPAVEAPTQADEIRANLIQQFERAGVPTATAQAYATFNESVILSLSTRAVEDPIETHNRYGLQVERPGITDPAGAVMPLAAGLSSTAMPADVEAQPLTPAEVQQLERRQVEAPAPERVERRRPVSAVSPELQELYTSIVESLGAKAGDLEAAAVRMLSEDPTLLARAQELRARALEPPAVVDILGPEVETEADVAATEEARARARERRRSALRRVTESPPPARESARQFRTRRTEHYTAVFDVVVNAAQELDPDVDLDALRAEFNDRVEMIESLDDEWKQSGHNPRRLLEEIAKRGGISLESEKKGGGMVGELRWIRESPALGPFGAFGGVRGVWRAVALARQGRTLDDMVGLLNQDPEFAYIEDINDLLLALEDVSRLGEAAAAGITLPGTEELGRRAGINLDVKWWASPAETEFGQERSLFEEGPEPAADLLETGELQPRLPGEASAVREGEIATPEMAAPFALTAEIARPARGRPMELPPSEAYLEARAAADRASAAFTEATRQFRAREIDDAAYLEARHAHEQAQAAFDLAFDREQARGRATTTLFHSAFHGSAAIFDQFSLHAIGTGEGAQAYGWGLYFASAREVADYYRETLAGKARGKDLLIDGAPVYDEFYKTLTEDLRGGLAEIYSRAHWSAVDDPQAIAKMRRELAVSIKNTRANLADGQSFSGDIAMDRIRLQQYESGLAFLDLYGDRLTVRGPFKPGRTYKVDIPDLPEYLQWDLPASQQSPKVQAALRSIGIEFAPLTMPTKREAHELLASKRLEELIEHDAAAREIVKEGLWYLNGANVTPDGRIDDPAFTKWFHQHAGLLTGTAVSDPLGETIYNDLKIRILQEHREAQGAAYVPGDFAGQSEAASRLLSQKGVAGIAYLDGQSRSSGEGTHNFVVFDDKLVQITEYFQSRAPQLAAIHQLSAENLQMADRMGGLALPSVAVTTAEMGALKGYGEVTLIGGRELADPIQNPVFDADAYTATFPPPEYGKAKQAAAQAVVNRFRAVAAEFDDAALTQEIWDNAINRPNPRDTILKMRRSLAAQAAFLREQGVEMVPILRRRNMQADFVQQPAFQAFLQDEGLRPNFAYDDLEYRKKLAAAVSAAIDEQTAADAVTGDFKERLLEARRKAWFDEDGLVFFGYTLRLERSVAAIGQMDVDYGQTRDAIAPLMVDRVPAFQAWIDDIILPLYPPPTLTVGRRKVDYTLPHIVEKMLQGKVNAQQDTMTFGEGKARTEAATRFTDLEWMRNASVQMRPEAEINEAREQTKTLLEDWRENVIAHYTGTDWQGRRDTWLALDASMRALARWAKSRRGSPEQRLRQALGREGFVGVPARVIAEGVTAGRAFLEAPVPYFESKPQRAVQLEEFQGAVIPENASQDTRELLERRGIPYVTYPTEEQRDSVLRVFREELAARGREVLFQERLGAIRFGPDRKFTIQLFAGANLSTFLHETGHFYLEVLGDFADKLGAVNPAELTDTQRQLLADYGNLLQWLGVENRSEITSAHHEKFARAFELYLRNGRAPSIALRGVFAKFRAWLLGIYRSDAELRVVMNKDVRAIFDRMVATDEAIKNAEAEAEIAPMFTTASDAHMSEQAFGFYRDRVLEASTQAREQLEQKLIAEVQREQQAEWRQQRQAIRDVVEREIHERREYRALAAMQRGTLPDGTPLVPGEEARPIKLSRAAIVREFGEARLKLLPRPYVYTTQSGGIEPTTAAELFGFSSGDELLRAIATVEPMRRAIERETDNRMIAQHGSILLDGSLHERAQAAVANDVRDQIVRTELRVLANLRRTVRPHVEHAVRAAGRERSYERRWLEAEAKLRIAFAEGRKQVEIDALQDEIDNLKRKAAGGPAAIGAAIPPQQVITHSARTRIAATRIRDLRPQVFWSASRRAAQSALESAARQDFEAAIVFKQQELLNLALYREAAKALEDADARVRAAKALGQPAARRRLGIAGQSYLDQIDGILDRYEFATVPASVLDRRAGLRRWVAAMEGEGLPVDLPELLLDEVRRVNHRELTYEELIGVTDGLEHIVHLSRLKNRLIKSAEARELNEVATEIATSIREKTKRRRKSTLQLRLPADERARMIEGVFAAHRKMSSLARELDGFEDGGPMWEHIIRPLNEAGDRETQMNAEATTQLAAIVQAAYPGREKTALYTKRFIPAIGDSVAKMNALMVALNWGNEGNRQRIKDGRKWSDTQVQAILDTLDARDWTFVKGIWAFVDSYWPQIEAKMQRVTGVAAEKVEPTPFDTPYGRMPGGYFRIKFEERESARAGELLEAESANFAKQAAHVQATTRRGHEQARQAKVFLPVRLDFGVIFEHVQEVIHDLSHHEALIDVGRVLGHRSVQSAIYDTQGDIVYKQFKAGVLDVAFGDRPAVNAFERSINHLRAGSTIAGLGWNVLTASLQPIGLTQSMQRIGSKWVAKGLSRWIRDAAHFENSVRWIIDRSPMMRTRFSTQNRELNEIRNKVGVNTGRLSGWMDEILQKTTFDRVTRQDIADSFFWLIQVLQRVADVPTWLGQYEKSMAAGETEAGAIAIADQAVLDAQAGGQIKDLAAVQRGGPMMRLWTNFYSFFSSTYNLAAEATRKRDLRKPSQVGRLAVDYLLLFTLPATLSYFLYAAAGREDTDEGVLEGLLRANVSYMMGAMLGLRELSGAVEGYFGYQGPAGARFFAAGSRLIKQIEQGELDAAFWRTLNEVAGMVLHYPAGQTRRTVEGVAAVAEGKADPQAILVGPPRE